MARKGSHQVDAILVPAAARAGREDEKLAPVALDEVAVGIPLLANSRCEDRVGILCATRVRDASISEKFSIFLAKTRCLEERRGVSTVCLTTHWSVENTDRPEGTCPVSYTHLTLPTN